MKRVCRNQMAGRSDKLARGHDGGTLAATARAKLLGSIQKHTTRSSRGYVPPLTRRAPGSRDFLWRPGLSRGLGLDYFEYRGLGRPGQDCLTPPARALGWPLGNLVGR